MGQDQGPHNSRMTSTTANGPQLEPGWQWAHSFADLGGSFHAPMQLQPLPDPYWVGYSGTAAQLLGFPATADAASAWLATWAGNHIPAGSRPVSTVYSGHQFGVWAGQLGDGRAILLGELIAPEASDTPAQEIQIKGAGLTPFSRRGDGRAVLRSSIREFLCSEAMHALGIPTTRALCVVGSDEPVYREQPETAAVVTRLAPSFIRFGHFEHFSHHGLHGELRTLADYVIDRFYPPCRTAAALAANPYANLLAAVTERTAHLLAQWQAVGFCHGVLNTDNMSILGLTIDYGPFQFMDGFDVNHICNHSDHQGRYAFARQPQVAYWNLYALGQALLPLFEDENLVEQALTPYQTLFPAALDSRMAAKLGFAQAAHGQRELVASLLRLMQAERVDWTIFWRRLYDCVAAGGPGDARLTQPVCDLFLDGDGINHWLLQFLEHIRQHSRGLDANLMLKANPAYVLRNHLAELAIQSAQRKDFAELRQLQSVLEHPFTTQPGRERYSDFAPDWAQSLTISCSS